VAPTALIERTDMPRAAAVEDFAWPDFDRWQAFFTAAEAFPSRWDGLHAAPPPRTPEAEVYLQRKLALFGEWLDMVAHRSVVRAHYARQGIRAKIVRQDADPACPACDPFHAREVGPDLDTAPPFHPGCRCVIVAMHTAPARRRPRIYERPHSRGVNAGDS
jgi:hypothetical protein